MFKLFSLNVSYMRVAENFYENDMRHATLWFMYQQSLSAFLPLRIARRKG